jgi:predicted permease
MRNPLDNLDDDIRDHIELEIRDNLERGMTPEDARAAAVRKFGNIPRIKEETREVWTWVWLEQLLQDLRYGFRWLRKNPGLSLITIFTLALGIGINTAVWSVVNSVLLRPLDYPHSERLVWLADYEPFFQRDAIFLSDYFVWRTHASSYTAMAAYGYNQAAMVTPKDASHITGVAVAGDFWEITGAHPALGRLFQPEERDTVVLSWELFQRQFGGDPNIVGSSVLLDGRPVTITGVLGRSFRFQFPAWWTPVRALAAEAFVPFPPGTDQASRTGEVVAALKPGVTTQQALAELEVLERHIFEQYRGPHPRQLFTKLRVEPLQEKLVGTARPALLVLLAAGAFVFLIATVNIANLLLARSTAREREIAIRAAVGAGRRRVVRQLFVESTIPALCGGALGLLLAHWGIQILVGLLPNALPRLAETGMDGSVLAFTLVMSLGAGILCGAGPALSAWRTNLYEALKDGARISSAASRARIRGLLVAGELALAMVLLTGAGLMLKSFVRMNVRPPGFAPDRILLVNIRLSGSQYDKKPPQ